MKLVLLFAAAAQTAKRNIALSNQQLLRDNPDHRLVSRPGELPFAKYSKIDNAHLSAAATATQTKAGLTYNKKPPIIGGFLLCYSS